MNTLFPFSSMKRTNLEVIALIQQGLGTWRKDQSKNFVCFRKYFSEVTANFIDQNENINRTKSMWVTYE